MEITKVYTRYDTPALVVNAPYFKELTAHELTDWSKSPYLESICEFTQCKLKSIEEGLEGVKYYHYANQCS